MLKLPEALKPLAAYKQFILWKAVPSTRQPGKMDKVPIHPQTGEVSNPHDPAIWVDADKAIALAAGGPLGVGFVFTRNDPFFFLDIDNALQVDNTWSPLAVQLCETFGGAAVEVSQSGKGLHIFGSGEYPAHGCRNGSNGLEFYTEGRFVALTGAGAVGDASARPQAAIDWLIASYFPPTATPTPAEWTDGPVDEWNGPEDDQELIDRMLASKSIGAAFSNRATVQDLWKADIDALAAAYPDPRGFDHSSADAALCQHLAFWTGKDCERMDRLFRLSGLFRDKWEDRPDYRQRTIGHAVSHCDTVYTRRAPASPPPLTAEQAEAAVDAGVVLRSGYQYLAVTQQIDFFKGCVYVQNKHRIFTPDGSLLKSEQFNATYGGYVFALDSSNDKTTKKAWEAFTESQAAKFPRAHDTCFRPEIKSGALIEEEGRVLLNTYIPIITPRLEGDPSLFLDVLGRILPEPGDREIILAYMAALVQYPGRKFQWAPMIQGAEGNGKSLIIRCLSYAVGHRYTHLPSASDIANKFNAWISNSLFIGVEEVYVSDRQEVLDVLKPMITNDRGEIQGKGDNQVTGDNRANFVMCSNHKDAIRKTQSDRRFCVFYTAQQSAEDIIRDGMGGQYFPRLYVWLKEKGGYAIVNNFLRQYAIPDALNPATSCHRAPVTSSTEEAVVMSRGGVEQEIIEAIEEGRPGFKGGWVSSMALDRLLTDRKDNKKVGHNKRRDLLRDLGYDYHPGLKEGRVNNPIPFEQGKPRLYIKRGHIHSNLTDGASILKHYMAAQEYMPSADIGSSGVMGDKK